MRVDGRQNISTVRCNIYTIWENRVRASFTHLTVVQEMNKYMQIKCIAKYIVRRIRLQESGKRIDTENLQVFSKKYNFK